MKIKPLGDKILVKRQEAETQTSSGIFLPDSAKEKPQQAEVIEVGEGRINEKSGNRVKLSVTKGDVVLLSKWGGTEVKVDGKDYLIVTENDVLGIVE
ncbi:MAG: co-chaperone GroES [Phycisphaera sp.]|nr:co-chaperone GroES [Phycisphaera sp.]